MYSIQNCTKYKSVMNTNDEIREKLLRFGIMPSLQRVAIMEYLMGHLTHPTAEVIFKDLCPAIPSLSKTTVYNTLKLFEEKGVIHAIKIDEKNVKYDAEISRHAHFKCKKCNKIIDIPLADVMVYEIEDSEEYVVTDLQVYYKGYCKDCRNVTN